MRLTPLVAAATLSHWLALFWSASPIAAQTLAPTGAAARTETAGVEPTGAAADSTAGPARSVWRDLFTQSAGDARRLPSRGTFTWLVVGTVAALGTTHADEPVGRSLSKATELREPFEPGALLGSTPMQLGASAAAYAIGRATSSPRVTAVSADLFRAQVMAQGLAIGMKQAFRRQRPDGGAFAFPSGHTTVSFASATVLQRHFGWKIGIPSYALASYVAVSRVQMERHHLSDVAFGAALGIAIGRTITVGRAKLEVSPLPGAAGVQFTWLGRGFGSASTAPAWPR
ncbi:MAG: phosphatase PAP2 family protein [Vicinamibacterales bacterium]